MRGLTVSDFDDFVGRIHMAGEGSTHLYVEVDCDTVSYVVKDRILTQEFRFSTLGAAIGMYNKLLKV